MKRKILFFMPNLDGGGAERVTTNIIRQLDKNSFDVFLVLTVKTGEYIELIPSEVEIIDLDTGKISKSFFELRCILKKIKPDIIFSSLFLTNILLYLSSFGLLKKTKMILRSPNSPKLILENKGMSIYIKYLLELAYKKADLVLAQTPEMKSEIVKYHNIESEKIQVFLNPIDKNFIDSQILNTVNMFDENNINVVAAGRLHKQKGFDTLIIAFKKVIEKNNKFRLFIIGQDKGEEENLRKIVDSLELNNYIELLGFQKNPYKYYYYSDLFVLSSRWEGLPNAILENLYLKKPIVSTKCIPFMSKLIKDKKNGFLVEVDSSDEMASSILNYKNLNFTADYNGENINEIFNEILKKD